MSKLESKGNIIEARTPLQDKKVFPLRIFSIIYLFIHLPIFISILDSQVSQLYHQSSCLQASSFNIRMATDTSLRQRSRTNNETPITETPSSSDDEKKPPIATDSSAYPSISQRAISQTLASTAHLANLLPTGTLLAFQLLVPTFTNNGTCDSVTRPLTLILLLVLAVSCSLASFTDSFKAPDGKVYHGIATWKGMWLFDYTGSSVPDLRNYRLRSIDFVHAVLSVFVFGTVALRDKNILSCFYPSPAHETQEVLDIVPLAIGLFCSLLFVVFPTTRHGIGYPVTSGN
ncbi:PREDICTED: uncharacterized protein LOC104596698 [Nelumbo nucifera]|uniref:Uncharacterized protein LOC104596698 n=1 Tax=Nelumbo nucifera TaxID=4432 RepID=A0A1U7ZQ02_NELNU|nr:PREDICTED: uncharacterized protein LOC104596698 [Nelumbo nucifera]